MDEVHWTQPALQDLDDIGAYIALDNPKAAETVVRRIIEAVSGLSFFPRIGRPGRVEGTRELVIGGIPYIAVYRVRERVEILAVYHGARAWPEAF
jgi:toxin ParE1/3/4